MPGGPAGHPRGGRDRSSQARPRPAVAGPVGRPRGSGSRAWTLSWYQTRGGVRPHSGSFSEHQPVARPARSQECVRARDGCQSSSACSASRGHRGSTCSWRGTSPWISAGVWGILPGVPDDSAAISRIGQVRQLPPQGCRDDRSRTLTRCSRRGRATTGPARWPLWPTRRPVRWPSSPPSTPPS